MTCSVIKFILILHLRIPPSKNHMIWLTAYDESRAIRDVKHGEVSPSRNTGKFQTVFDSHLSF